MVLVFHQMIVSALLYLSKKLKALALNVSGKAEDGRGVWLTTQAQVRDVFASASALNQFSPLVLFSVKDVEPSGSLFTIH